MLHISDILIQSQDMHSFAELVLAVRRGARTERFMRMDIKPPFPDTPENWEAMLEAAFSSPIEPDQTEHTP